MCVCVCRGGGICWGTDSGPGMGSIRSSRQCESRSMNVCVCVCVCVCVRAAAIACCRQFVTTLEGITRQEIV